MFKQKLEVIHCRLYHCTVHRHTVSRTDNNSMCDLFSNGEREWVQRKTTPNVHGLLPFREEQRDHCHHLRQTKGPHQVCLPRINDARGCDEADAYHRIDKDHAR